MKLLPGDDDLTVVAKLGSSEELTAKLIKRARSWARRRSALFVEVYRGRVPLRLMLAHDAKRTAA